jgi:hypothetical protein
VGCDQVAVDQFTQALGWMTEPSSEQAAVPNAILIPAFGDAAAEPFLGTARTKNAIIIEETYPQEIVEALLHQIKVHD